MEQNQVVGGLGRTRNREGEGRIQEDDLLRVLQGGWDV